MLLNSIRTGVSLTPDSNKWMFIANREITWEIHYLWSKCLHSNTSNYHVILF